MLCRTTYLEIDVESERNLASDPANNLTGTNLGIAHGYVALVHGLAAADSAQRLGRTDAAIQRRWNASVRALLAGFAVAA